ncbi:hypothetical protein FGSG_13366 [Fusarium graminearum PH-1]|uniref:hypothetical protein n=1 Tax=Gibberella zeae (strain ATCC MYA-4620 / CBS 123657 / FGSC 9075 / NRRL 31084 / PH-1) TaxID=229533 RepID=UPI00021F1FB9|nr:hypothetical protein FGSG_13366 [Fusarium graminearum PH-1]ESU14908.1 hypothetical protein FGSG_13366 [Fusarium graminearum PH-1]|eukprot:XP_011320333.1 hypothetical protein FGSG_13366 [Fusarium graminearum PH-1]
MQRSYALLGYCNMPRPNIRLTICDASSTGQSTKTPKVTQHLSKKRLVRTRGSFCMDKVNLHHNWRIFNLDSRSFYQVTTGKCRPHFKKRSGVAESMSRDGAPCLISGINQERIGIWFRSTIGTWGGS